MSPQTHPFLGLVIATGLIGALFDVWPAAFVAATALVVGFLVYRESTAESSLGTRVEELEEEVTETLATAATAVESLSKTCQELKAEIANLKTRAGFRGQS